MKKSNASSRKNHRAGTTSKTSTNMCNEVKEVKIFLDTFIDMDGYSFFRFPHNRSFGSLSIELSFDGNSSRVDPLLSIVFGTSMCCLQHSMNV